MRRNNAFKHTHIYIYMEVRESLRKPGTVRVTPNLRLWVCLSLQNLSNISSFVHESDCYSTSEVKLPHTATKRPPPSNTGACDFHTHFLAGRGCEDFQHSMCFCFSSKKPFYLASHNGSKKNAHSTTHERIMSQIVTLSSCSNSFIQS